MKSLLLICTFGISLMLPCSAYAIGFGHRGGGGCANGHCGGGESSSCANGHCSEGHCSGYSEGSSGGAMGSTPRKIFTRRSSGGCTGGSCTGSSYSGGSTGGASAKYNEATNSCQCTCPNCGTKFECPCSGTTTMTNKCNCCDKCTGKPGCTCGCESCKCNYAAKKDAKKETANPPAEK